MKAKLTKSLISGTQSGEREKIIWDEDVPGLGLRVTKQGAKSYLLKTRLGRGRGARVIKPTLGSIGDMTPDQARELAREWKAMAKKGVDPAQLQRDEATAPIMAQLCEDYLAGHAAGKRTGAEDRRKIEKHILPTLRNVRVKDVTTRHIEDLHRALGKTSPYSANRLIALLSKMFFLAIRWGWRDNNPTAQIDKFPEEKRERYLSKRELARLNDALEAYAFDGGPDRRVAADAIRLLVLTGARKSEVLRATWEQFDLDAGVWTKPSSHTKQKRAHRVPLSQPALDLLNAVRARQGDQGEYVCPGRAGGHRDDLKSAWREISRVAGLEDVRIHDLRHTFASLLVQGGVALPIIGGLLGHTQVQTTARYAHLADDPLRDATNLVGSLVETSRR